MCDSRDNWRPQPGEWKNSHLIRYKMTGSGFRCDKTCWHGRRYESGICVSAEPNTHTPMNTESLRPTSSLRFARSTALFAVTTTLMLVALLPARLQADDAGSRVHALVNLEFSDKYLTPRGMIVQDHGLTMQTLFLAFVNVYNGAPEDFINSITLIPGFWNDFATSPIPAHLTAGSKGTDWVEYDPILGVSIGFAKNFKLDVTYTEFAMQILDIGTSQHLETKLSYDDSAAMGAFAMHPYVSYWKELTNKATAAANFGAPSSYYFEVGIDPSMMIGKTKLEAPIRVLLPNKNFYGETFATSSTVGLYEIGLKATMPMTFMPAGYGHWSFHIGAKYMKFVDKNLQQLATSGGFGSPTKDTGQIYTGFTSFF